MPVDYVTDTATAMRVVQLGGHIGARIDGIRLGGGLDAVTVAIIQDALATHRVVFLGISST